MKKNNYWNVINRLLSYMGKSKLLFVILSLGSAVVFTFNRILISFANMGMINSVAQKNYFMLYRAFAYAALAFVLLFIVDPVIRHIKDVIAIKGMRNFRLDFLFHLERLSMRYFDNNLSGDLITRVSGDINKINSMWYGQLRSLLVSLFHGIGAAVTILIIDWRLFLIAAVSGLVTTRMNLIFSKPIGEISDRIQMNTSRSTQILLDIINGARVIKIFGLSDIMQAKFNVENDSAAKETIKKSVKNAQMESASFLLSAFNLLGVLIIGLLMVSKDLIDIGSVVAAITLQSGISTMFLSLGSWISRMKVSLTSAERIFEVLDEAIEHEPAAINSIEEDIRDFSISFENVSFGYDDKDSVLHNFNMQFEHYNKTALVGDSGGGKSTIIKLLLGFYSPHTGVIKIGGRCIKSFSLKELRDMISYVPQEPYLFNGTIIENIQYGKENASIEQIQEAAKAANAHEFIMSLPEGYQSQVGEGGGRLSGGERQRIALARAILKDAPILLLDEATSALDSENEQLIQQALIEFMKNRTSIVIAHRLSTIEDADKICVIEKGSIAEVGDHEALMERREHYYRLRNAVLQHDKAAG